MGRGLGAFYYRAGRITGMVRACTALVRGRVQGVNFRDFARRRAAGLGLVGHARNLPDGATVEVYVEGDESAVRSFLEDLRAGPALSRVDRVEEEWLPPKGGLREFRVMW